MLRQRVLTAVLLGAALLAVILWLPAAAALGVFAGVVLVGAWEWSSFARFATPAARWLFVAIVGIAMILMWFYSQSEAHLHALLLVALVWWILAFFWLSLAPTSQTRATVMGSGLLVLVPAWVAIGLWFVFQVVYSLIDLGGTGGGVAYGAHIGGFIAGLALVYPFMLGRNFRRPAG